MSANPFAGAEFLLSCAQLRQLPQADRPECAFAGRSNAGKSSAINRLCQRRGLARTSKTPGRTQLLNYFALERGYLVDLPGYGYAKVPPAIRKSWGELVGGYVRQRPSLVGIVVVMDVRHPLTDFDVQLLEWAEASGRAVHILLTKADKLSRGRAKTTLLQVRKQLAPGIGCQLFSAQDGTGVEEARTAVAAWLHTDTDTPVTEA